MLTVENTSPSSLDQSQMNVGLASLIRKRKIQEYKNKIENTTVEDDKKTSTAKKSKVS